MNKKYYRYCPIVLTTKAYDLKILNEETTFKEYNYTFQKRNDFGLVCLYEYYYRVNLTKNNLYDKINYICYYEDGNLYDLITGEVLTPIDITKNIIRKDNKIYIDGTKLENENVSNVLNTLKIFPKRELKKYKQYLCEKIKTKSDLNYLCNKYIQEDKRKQEIISNKVEKRIKKLRKIK